MDSKVPLFLLGGSAIDKEWQEVRAPCWPPNFILNSLLLLIFTGDVHAPEGKELLGLSICIYPAFEDTVSFPSSTPALLFKMSCFKQSTLTLKMQCLLFYLTIYLMQCLLYSIPFTCLHFSSCQNLSSSIWDFFQRVSVGLKCLASCMPKNVFIFPSQ